MSSTPAPPAGFLYVPSPAEYADDRALVVRVPRGLRSKQKLLCVLADKLRFPAYFGHNWDALEECLGDLSWLPEELIVAIVHSDLPFSPRGENRTAYVSILERWVASAPARGRRLAIFPLDVRREIESEGTESH